jgi:hypothetical protein
MSSKEEEILIASKLLVDSNKAIVIANNDFANSQLLGATTPSFDRGRQPKKR